MGWSDIVFTANPGTIMDGTSFVVQKSDPRAILTANMNCRSDGRSAIRILMNGNVVNNSSDIGGYDVCGGTAVSYPLTAGDKGEGLVPPNQPVRNHYLHTKRLRRSVKKGRPYRDSLGASFAVSYGVTCRMSWAELVGSTVAVGGLC